MTQNDHQTEGMTHYVGGETIFFFFTKCFTGRQLDRPPITSLMQNYWEGF